MLKVFGVYFSGDVHSPGGSRGNREEIAVKSYKFKGGEQHPTVTTTGRPDTLHIQAHLDDGDAIMELLMVTDALRRVWPKAPIVLIMPYIPYARQDRVANPGEAFGLKVFCKLINDQGYERVIVQDPHSHVATALLDRVYVDESITAIEEVVRHMVEQYGKMPVLVAPDSGARKRTLDVAKALGGLQVITADKKRDTKTLEITGTVLHDPLPNEPMLIIDDICDGGRTFIELAKTIRAEEALMEDPDGPAPLWLYITHGIFSYGAELLLEHFNKVYTRNDWTSDSRVNEV